MFHKFDFGILDRMNNNRKFFVIENNLLSLENNLELYFAYQLNQYKIEEVGIFDLKSFHLIFS